MRFCICLVSSLLLACNSNSSTETSGKDAVIHTTKHASPKVDDFANKSFLCCDTPAATTLLQRYLDLTSAMAADSDAKTKEAVVALDAHMHTPEFSALPWVTEVQELQQASAYWKTLPREDIQQDFASASQTMVAFVQKHKATQTDATIQVIVAFCPMAPGRWVQTEKELRNPYYGSKMLTCGVFE